MTNCVKWTGEILFSSLLCNWWGWQTELSGPEKYTQKELLWQVGTRSQVSYVERVITLDYCRSIYVHNILLWENIITLHILKPMRNLWSTGRSCHSPATVLPTFIEMKIWAAFKHFIYTNCYIAEQYSHIYTNCYIAEQYSHIYTNCYIAEQYSHIYTNCYIAEQYSHIYTNCYIAEQYSHIIYSNLVTNLTVCWNKVLIQSFRF